ncbi:nucleoid-associated protein [Aeromonas sobria]|uniref:nucleoid-associated protein n=1 Tax=Aeromonas sobria TaxID=646 RepID=UPI0011DF38A8|nr:nucleoid-associated protein [Aeromonas sobria]
MLEATDEVEVSEELYDIELNKKARLLIKNFVIHKVFWKIREDKSKEPSFKLREIENDVNGLSEHVVELLGGLFRTTSLASGCFQSDHQPDGGNPPIEPSFFQAQLNTKFIDNNLNGFLELTRRATRDFSKNHWGKAGSAKPGYLLFYTYQFNEETFLAVVMLHETTGMVLDDDLVLNSVDPLDLNKLHLAVRINLTSWKDPNRLSPKYLRFKLGKGAGDMRQFFISFIGCDEYINNRSDTVALKTAIETFCNEMQYDHERKNNVLQDAVDYIKLNTNQDGQIPLEGLSNRLFPDNPAEFRVHAQDNHNLSDKVGIDKNSLSKFTSFNGRSKIISIRFVRSALGNEVKFDSIKKTLQINEIPRDLLEMLMEDEQLD